MKPLGAFRGKEIQPVLKVPFFQIALLLLFLDRQRIISF
jgi:hypothetical protein